jgi:hypothetical protein
MSRELYYANRWNVGAWQFFEIDGRQISDTYEGRKLYGFEVQAEDGARPEVGNVREWFNSLEHAMAAAIAEKYTGPRGAGGSGVGTAADWFMRMIGADQLVAAEDRDAQAALQDVLHATEREDGPLFRRARAISSWLERNGLVLARQNHL